MSATNETYLSAFALWLRTLAQDASAVAEVLSTDAGSAPASAWIAASLNYLFKSLDLIPDGIDDIGYLDDAFVLRVAAEHAKRDGVGTPSGRPGEVLERLAGEVGLVREFLGPDYVRLDRYVESLRKASARGRSVADVLASPEARREFVSEVQRFAAGYEVPGFSQVDKTLIKLRAFFDAKLPR